MTQEQFATLEIRTDTPPLRQDDSGAVRIGTTQVLLELVIRAFEDGATPESIVQRYPSTTLGDIYAVIAVLSNATLRNASDRPETSGSELKSTRATCLKSVAACLPSGFRNGCQCYGWRAMKTSTATSCAVCCFVFPN